MTPDTDDPAAFRQRTEVLNGARWHLAEADDDAAPGTRPLLILLHGFPYSGYAWRKLMRPLAAAGYRVVVPDLLGYGLSDAPEDTTRYAHLRVVADLVALVRQLGETSAALLGHDVGASIAFAAGQMRPDLFTALVLMNTPPMLRADVAPAVQWQRQQTGGIFYQAYFAGLDAVGELDADIRRSLRSIMFSISGAAKGADRWRSTMAPGEGFLDTVVDPPQFPAWLSPRALAHYVALYERGGFFGPLASYRCRPLNWDQCAFLQGMRPPQPSLFIGGAADPALDRFRSVVDQLESTLPGLRGKPLIPGAGHSVTEEVPDEVLAHVLPFLKAALPPPAAARP